ncbi:MAG: hypothetical protein AAGB29_06050 [Planctomycetota bacterium]
MSKKNRNRRVRPAKPAWVARVLRVEWLGQTVASVCWITSVFFYGLSGTGDYLQLSAASAWLIANIAAIVTAEEMRQWLRIPTSQPAPALVEATEPQAPGWEPAEPAST